MEVKRSNHCLNTEYSFQVCWTMISKLLGNTYFSHILWRCGRVTSKNCSIILQVMYLLFFCCYKIPWQKKNLKKRSFWLMVPFNTWLKKWQQVAGGGSWKIIFSYTGMNQRKQVWVGLGYKVSKHIPSNTLPPARLHLLKFPQPPKQSLIVDQAFN